jgi:hypothetical protein
MVSTPAPPAMVSLPASAFMLSLSADLTTPSSLWLVIIKDVATCAVAVPLVKAIKPSGSHIGVAVAAGAKRRVVSTPEAFRAKLLATPSLAYSCAGASGLFFAGLIERLGIAAEVNAPCCK